MSPNLPWTVVLAYCAYAVLAAQLKFSCRDHAKSNQLLFLIFGYSGIVTSLFGFGFLVYYGIRTTWWAPLVLGFLGLLAYVPFSLFESVLIRLVPIQVWGWMSLALIPAFGALMVYATP